MDDKLRMKALEELRNCDNKDLSQMIKIEQKYGLGYNYLVEFVDKPIAQKMQVLYEYCHLNNLPLLYVLNNNKKLLNKNLSNEEIITKFMGLDKKDAHELVATTDKRNKQVREEFSKKFVSGLTRALNSVAGGYALTSKTINMTPEERAQKAFAEGWCSIDDLQDIFSEDKEV